MLIEGVDIDLQGKYGLHLTNPKAGELALTWVVKEGGITEIKIVPLKLDDNPTITELLRRGVPKYQETVIY